MAQRARRQPTVPFDQTPVVDHVRRCLRTRRLAAGLNLMDVAEMIGCSEAHMSRLEGVEAEKGKHGPSHLHVGLLAHIAHALDTPLAAFLPLPEPSVYQEILLLLQALSPQSLQAVLAVVTALQPTRGRLARVSPTTSSLQCEECAFA